MKKIATPVLTERKRAQRRNASAKSIFAHAKNDRARSRNYTVTVVGLGYVGLPLALEALKGGYTVHGVDKNRELVRVLSEGRAPAHLEEANLRFFRRRYQDMRFSETVLRPSDAYVVCVPTPVLPDKTPDLEPLLGATKLIAPHVRRGTLVVIESTVNPGVCEEFVLPIIERETGLRAERDFFFAHCPERINPGDPRWTVATIPRVLGTSGKRSDAAALSLYESIIKAPITLMSNIKEAEAVKMVENTFRDINIAFVNELAMAFTKAGIDTMNVLRGASTKPFGFMAHYPGCGVGGHCIPVDPYYLIAYGHRNGFNHRFLEVAREINNHMPEYTVSLLTERLAKRGIDIRGKKVALLGLSYKKDVPDLRESPALDIAEALTKAGAVVATYDPLVLGRSTAKSLDEALDGAVGAIVATNHTVFGELSPEALLRHDIRVIVDGRNCLEKAKFESAGIDYSGIGR
ncbi:MAG TPA: nucleotide sugar dehydrogenase [Candidatus Paceibacterota bacterium]|nr:nucleotide sugar dehydrogenase [Candidatus Paceibacterota bacterium]